MSLKQDVKSESELLLQYYENILHDIKTPISIINLYLQNILAAPWAYVTEDVLTIALKHCQDIIRLLENASDCGKIAHGSFAPRLLEHDAVALIYDITQAVLALSDRKSLKVSFTSDTDEIFMPLDKDMLERVMFNILSNAIKFTPPNGRIDVFFRKLDGSISVEVTDTGPGFNDTNNIFNRYMSKNINSIQNSGIGLTIVAEIVSALGGSVTAKNREAGGASVTVTLPVFSANNMPYLSIEKKDSQIALFDV